MAGLAVALGVALPVLLMALSFGVRGSINARLDIPALRGGTLVDVDLIQSILTLLTVAVSAATVVTTAITTYVIGAMVMRARREEIAVRRQSGAFRAPLVWEFARVMLRVAVVGGLLGEASAVWVGVILSRLTILPVEFNPIVLLSALPITVGAAMVATLLPAWRAVNVSPALLRKT